MAKLERLIIKHFRGIENFEQRFKGGITCIIGRGDSGKSTILDAISYVFSQSWGVLHPYQ
jgi:predicted ATP-dependent endonuclease of OLD family